MPSRPIRAHRIFPSLRENAFAGLFLLALLVPVFLPVHKVLVAHPDQILGGKDIRFDYAYEVLNRAALGEGKIPFWNPYMYCGVPHFANNNALVLYPITVLLRPLSIQQAHFWFVLLHIWIAGFGVFRLCRTLGSSRTAALLAGIGFMLGGQFAPKIYGGHMTFISTAAWIPWVMLFAVRSAARGGLWPHPMLPVCLTLGYLAGSTQLVIYTLAVLGTYYLVRVVEAVIRRHRARAGELAVQSTLSVLLFLALSAFQFLPMREMYAEAGRTGGLSYETVTKGSLHPSHLRTLLFPTALTDASRDYEDGYSGGLWEKSAFVGKAIVLLLPLSLLAMRERRHLIFFMALALGALLMTFGTALPFYRLHHAVLPMLRIPGRLLPFWCLGAAVCGAAGLDMLRNVARSAAVRAVGWGCLALSLAAFAFLVVLQPHRGESLWPALATAAALLIAGGVSFLHARGLAGKTVLSGALGLCVLAASGDMAVFARQFSVTSTIDDGPLVADAFKGLDVGRVFPGCEYPALLSGVPSVDGKTPIYLRDFGTMAALFLGDRRAAEEGGLPALPPLGGRLPWARGLFRLFNVTHWLTYAHVPIESNPGEPLRTAGPYQVYASPIPAPRAFWSDDVKTVSRAAAIDVLLRFGEADVPKGSATPTPGPEAAWPSIKIRYSENVKAGEIRSLENARDLHHGRYEGNRTWSYLVKDSSDENIRAIVADRRVEDTDNIDRPAGKIVRLAAAVLKEPRKARRPGGSETVVLPPSMEGSAGTVIRVKDTIDARLDAEVTAPRDGMIFLSEIFFPGRQVRVNGRTAEVKRVNFAFIGIDVTAGRHVLELRYFPRQFFLGLAVGFLGILALIFSAIKRGVERGSLACSDHATD